jgi:hypothetical protein
VEASKKKRLLQCIVNVCEAAKGSKLNDTLFEKIDAELKELSVYFKVSKMQAFFLANEFVMNHKHEPIHLMTLFKYDHLSFRKFLNQLDIIYSNRIRLKHISTDRYMIAFRNKEFIINEKLRNQFSLICQCRNCRK